MQVSKQSFCPPPPPRPCSSPDISDLGGTFSVTTFLALVFKPLNLSCHSCSCLKLQTGMQGFWKELAPETDKCVKCVHVWWRWQWWW